MDQKRQRLYVADPDVKKIYMYQLSTRDGELHVAGRRKTVCREAESRWVAVDNVGNVFFSDEPRSRILKLSADRAMRGERSPEIIVDGAVFAEVNDPGGVAVDTFNVYWTNKRAGARVGSIVKGPETLVAGAVQKSVSVLARKAIKSYGLCLAFDNVYFTDSEKSLFAVKKNGGPITEISSQLQNPRGCAWDGDGTVYVADRGGNAVYAFAGNMQHLKHAQLNKAFDYEDAFGLAVAMEVDDNDLSFLNVFEQREKKVPVNKITLAIVNGLGLGVFGVDRLLCGQHLLGIVKFCTGGGCFLWFLVDYIIITTNCLMKYEELTTLGFNATFESSELQSAFWLTIVVLVCLLLKLLLVCSLALAKVALGK
jgi:sugar lactone lactonase YvrE